MTIIRRDLLAAVTMATAMPWPDRRALAQSAGALATGALPTGTLRIIVPAPPGGPTDILARALADKAGPALGLPVVVDNRAGGGAVIGSELAARAAPDGLTLVLGHNQSHASNQAMMPRLPFHVLESFTPVCRLATVHHATVVAANHPARDMAGLIARGKNGGRLTYASSQAGSASHVIAETFVRREGLEATHIPYRGAAPAATDTVAGVVDFYVATFPSVAGLVRDGRLRGLAIGAPARVDGFPDVPTAAEAGVPFMAVDAWFGLFGPRGLPPAIVARLSGVMLAALADPDTARRLGASGFTAAPQGPADFAAFQRAEVARWADMAQLTGVRLED